MNVNKDLGKLLNRYRFVLISIVLPVLVLLVLVLQVGPVFKSDALHVSSFLVIVVALVFGSYLAYIEFESPAIIAPNLVLSCNSAEFETAQFLGTTWALIFAGGANSPKRFYSPRDINARHETTLVVAPTRIVESMGHGRFLVIRGPVEPAGKTAGEVLLKIPAVRDAMRARGVRHANLQICFSATELHEHEPVERVNLDVLEKQLRDYQDDLAAVVRLDEERMRTQLDFFDRVTKSGRKRLMR